MNYSDVLEMAGAKVHNYEEFGSWQGDWYALVTYNGKTGWVTGYFGSCSGCDALQHEFGYESHEHENGEYVSYYDDELFLDGCPTCQGYKERLVDFGKRYLEDILTQEEVTKHALEDEDWDTSCKEVLAWITKTYESYILSECNE